jgi:hypothetical protein
LRSPREVICTCDPSPWHRLFHTELPRPLWLAWLALPVGGFSYSEGLEAAVDAGVVHDEASAGDWLLNRLELLQVRAQVPGDPCHGA